jgi:hypothetical protein
LQYLVFFNGEAGESVPYIGRTDKRVTLPYGRKLEKRPVLRISPD